MANSHSEDIIPVKTIRVLIDDSNAISGNVEIPKIGNSGKKVLRGLWLEFNAPGQVAMEFHDGQRAIIVMTHRQLLSWAPVRILSGAGLTSTTIRNLWAVY